MLSDVDRWAGVKGRGFLRKLEVPEARATQSHIGKWRPRTIATGVKVVAGVIIMGMYFVSNGTGLVRGRVVLV